MARISLVTAILAATTILAARNPVVDGDSRTVAPGDAKVPAGAVVPSEIVLSVHGICPVSQNPPPGAKECTVVVKQQEFDDLLKIVSPSEKVTASQRRSFAATYAELLAFAAAAQKAGLDQSGQFRQTLDWLRLRTLADLYRRDLQKKAAAPSEAEVNEYYRQNISQFEEVKLQRILLPKNNFAAKDKAEFEKQELEVAAGLRARAVQGEDLDELEKEAYTTLGFYGVPPAAVVGIRRRSELASEVSEDVFSLKPGEVSKVESENYCLAIYKIEDKWTLAEERAKEEIVRKITKQKQEASFQAVTGDLHLDLNESYFGGAAKK